jgi:hypothetical protein
MISPIYCFNGGIMGRSSVGYEPRFDYIIQFDSISKANLMNARVLFPVFVLLVSACQSSLPFYTKTVDDPEWFKAKAAAADAKGYPPTRAVPPRPKNTTTPAVRDATLKSLEAAGAKLRENPRSALSDENPIDLEQFSKDAQAETAPPPMIDDTTRPE